MCHVGNYSGTYAKSVHSYIGRSRHIFFLTTTSVRLITEYAYEERLLVFIIFYKVLRSLNPYLKYKLT